MKKIFSLILLLGLAISCSKDSETTPEKVESKPISLEVMTPQGFGSAGIKLMGRVLHLNEETVIEHGFLLAEKKTFENTQSIRLKINNKIQSGTNEMLFTDFPKTAVNYEIKYFIKTQNKEYLSKALEFQYIPITLEPFSERNVNQGDIIRVNGDFSKLSDDYYIAYYIENSMSAEAIPMQISADKKSLTFTISQRFGHGDEPSFVLTTNTSMPIYLGRVNVLAELLPPAEFVLNYRDYLTFTATGYKYSTKKPFSIIVGSNSFSLKTHTQTTVSDLVNGLKGNSFKFGYYNGLDTIYFSKPLTLSAPNSNDFYLRETSTHPNSSLRLSVYGLNEKMPLEASKTTLGSYPARVIPTWNGEDWLTVGEIPNGNYNIKFENDFFTYTPTEKITVKKLEVSSLSPSVIRDGELLTISGNFINGRTYRVYSNQGMATSEPAVNGKIEVYLDDEKGDQFDITQVGYYDENLKKETLINVSYHTELSPVTYTHFSPLKGNSSTAIKVYGEGIGRAMIFFDGKWMPAMEWGKGWASFSPYSGTLPGKYKIAVFHKNKWLTVDQVYEYVY